MKFRTLLLWLAAALVLPLVLRAEQPAGDESKGIFVAAGYGGRRISSRDGITWENMQQWEEKGGDDSSNLISATFGNGKFVVVGGGGWSKDTQAGHILVSKDGKDWNEVKKMAFRVSPVMFGNKRFVVGGPDKQLWWSEDGENWKEGPKINFEGWAFWFRQGAFGNGVFVFTGNADPKQKTSWAAVTPDGEKISSFQTDLPPNRDIAFGNGRFVIVGPDGLRMSSTDGLKWENRENSPGDGLSRVIWTGIEFLATGGKTAWRSPDGVAWKKVETRIPCEVLWANNKILIGTTWPGQMWSSTDGAAWKKGVPMTPNGINAVVYGIPK